MSPLSDTTVHVQSSSYKKKTVIIALVPVCVVAVVAVSIFLGVRLCLRSKMPPPMDVPQYLLEPPLTPCHFDLDQLKLCQMLSKGRYGEVWQGQLGDTDVAVKLFTQQQRQYYQNEREIYQLPHMEHISLLNFYGSEERLTVDGVAEYLLVLEYCPSGTLTNHLKNHTLCWSTFCKMAHSITAGLAHLHNDITKYGKLITGSWSGLLGQNSHTRSIYKKCIDSKYTGLYSECKILLH